MKKRPVFTAALLFALLILLLKGVCGVDFSRCSFSDGEVMQLTGTVRAVQNKTNSRAVLLSSALCEREYSEGNVIRAGTVILNLDPEAYEQSGILPGNRVTLKAEYQAFKQARNAGNFDEQAYYASQGIRAKFRPEDEIRIVSRRIDVIRVAMQRLKEKLADSIQGIAGKGDDEGKDFAAFLLAIITGDRSGLDTETKDLYRKSGIAHILAISGLHISLVGMALFSFLRKRLPFVPSALISGAVMICFCIMSGESASAVRATVMFLLRLLAQCLGKTFDMLTALGVSAIFLLIENPMYLFYSGFLLSFGAILALGLLAPAVERIVLPGRQESAALSGGSFVRAYDRGIKSRLQPFIRSLIASGSVTMFTLPMIVNSYYEVPLFSVFLNLFVIPGMSVVLGSGLAGTILGLISLFLGRFLVGGSYYLVSLIEIICGLIDQVSFSTVVCGNMAGWKVFVYYGILLVFCLYSRVGRKRRKKASPLTVLGVLTVLLLLVFLDFAQSNLPITMFDVDQGESILLESPSGAVYMIDGGSSSVTDLYKYRLESALKYRGISRLDAVIITHPDTDHISGILDMLQKEGAGRIQVGRILIPYVPDNENYQMLLAAAEEQSIPVSGLHAGMTIDDGEVSLQCLHPSSGFVSEEVNAYSAVLHLQYGSFDALFTGDLSAEEEQLLLSEQRIPACELLKVAHHGSRNSSSEAFVKAVGPKLSVVSAGVDNSYGHPHPDTLKRLEEAGSRICVTAEGGEIMIEADRNGRMQVRQWQDVS